MGRRGRRSASQRRRHAGRAGRLGGRRRQRRPEVDRAAHDRRRRPWTPQDPGDISFDLAAVHVLDAQTAWAVGDGQQILVTTDGGATWTSTRGDVVGPVTRVQGATARRGDRLTLPYVVGDDWSSRVRVAIHISEAHGHPLTSRALGWRRTGETAHHYSFRCDLPRGTYLIRAYATDRAGNPQSRMTAGKLVVR
jgi:hypothetical protein